MSNNQVRTADKDIKKGLWKNNTHDRCIKVRSVGLTIISYSNEGCSGVYNMGVSELLSNYQLCEADKESVTDDPIARPYDIQWDIGTQDKSETILVTVCSKCGSTVPADSVEQPALSRWVARFINVVKGMR